MNFMAWSSRSQRTASLQVPGRMVAESPSRNINADFEFSCESERRNTSNWDTFTRMTFWVCGWKYISHAPPLEERQAHVYSDLFSGFVNCLDRHKAPTSQGELFGEDIDFIRGPFRPNLRALSCRFYHDPCSVQISNPRITEVKIPNRKGSRVWSRKQASTGLFINISVLRSASNNRLHLSYVWNRTEHP